MRSARGQPRDRCSGARRGLLEPAASEGPGGRYRSRSTRGATAHRTAHGVLSRDGRVVSTRGNPRYVIGGGAPVRIRPRERARRAEHCATPASPSDCVDARHGNSERDLGQPVVAGNSGTDPEGETASRVMVESFSSGRQDLVDLGRIRAERQMSALMEDTVRCYRVASAAREPARAARVSDLGWRPQR